MMKVLAFDTSSKALSVAILDGEQLLADVTVNVKKNHSINLMPAIDFLMNSVDLKPADLDRIVVAQGPGSYTGLRVAVATAKTLAYALGIELVGVSSLYALAAATEFSGMIVPVMDARRNNVYAGFYRDGQLVKEEAHMAFPEVLAAVQDEKTSCLSVKWLLSRRKLKRRYPKLKCCQYCHQLMPLENMDKP